MSNDETAERNAAPKNSEVGAPKSRETFRGENPLATEKINKLIPKFAIPSIISFLVNSLYNIVDQIFIGQGVGMYGNGATNVAFPLVTVSTSIALLLGIGSASNFSLRMGEGRKEKAGRIVCTGILLLAVFGTALGAAMMIFLKPLLHAFGATENVMPYATVYTSITALGIPLVTFSAGASHLVRADGSPTYSMICVLSGAILNTILDPIFIFVFDMGIAGAAWATVIGQAVSAALVIRYLFRFKSVKFSKSYFKPSFQNFKAIVSLGCASFFNQIAMAAVQITMNNTLTHYGAASQYGSDIPLACVGVISKVNMLFLGFTIGIAQGCQPINGYNYGAKNYGRVKETYTKAIIAATGISVIAFLAFQIIPREIVSIFGQGSETYYKFAERYFRIFMLMTFVNGVQPVTANFFTSIGKARVGLLISLTRQILFLLPLVIILPLFFGIDGVMYAGPIADASAAVLAAAFIIREMRLLTRAGLAQERGIETAK
jgi:Na+-driven multidrug efflux pump